MKDVLKGMKQTQFFTNRAVKKRETGRPSELRKILSKKPYSIVMQLGLLGFAIFFQYFFHRSIDPILKYGGR